MENYSIDQIKDFAAQKFKNNDMTSLFLFLTNQINTCNDRKKKNKLILLKTECYQRIGDLKSAELALDGFSKQVASHDENVEFEILKLKITFQNGVWDKAFDSSENLINQYKIKKGNVLWRTSLLYSIFGDKKNSKKFSEYHRDNIQKEGFQEANNILYTNVVPNLMHNDISSALSVAISPLEYTQDIYMYSDINFDVNKRIGSRLKSCCQSLILESFYQWEFNNKHNSYMLAILTGLCMSWAKLTLKAEGIGEIISLFYNKYNSLVELIRDASRYTPDIFLKNLNRYSDSDTIRKAYNEATISFQNIIESYKKKKEPSFVESDQQIYKSHGDIIKNF